MTPRRRGTSGIPDTAGLIQNRNFLPGEKIYTTCFGSLKGPSGIKIYWPERGTIRWALAQYYSSTAYNFYICILYFKLLFKFLSFFIANLIELNNFFGKMLARAQPRSNSLLLLGKLINYEQNLVIECAGRNRNASGKLNILS